MDNFREMIELTPAPGEYIDFERIWSIWPYRMTAMDGCPQDPSYHAEGDVGVHTRSVMSALVGLPEWQQRSEVDRFVLFWATVLHDVAKPVTTVVDDDGRISAPNHSRIGAQIARELLYKADVDFFIRERICGIILAHQRPFHFMESSDPDREAIKMCYMAPVRDVVLHAKADLLGRDGIGVDDAMESTEMLLSVAEDRGCESRKYWFDSSTARLGFLRDNKPISYIPHVDFGSKVTMLYGLPGSGKDTWIKNHARDLPVVSTDALRVELGIKPDSKRQGEVMQAAKERAREYLRKKQDFVFNATNIDSRIRTPFVDLFHDYGAHITGVNIEVGYREWRQQNAKRRHKEVVPDVYLDKSVARMEPISFREVHDVDNFVQRFDHNLSPELPASSMDAGL
ncbi:AAA family ATPase [Sulfitobacter sp. R18_1]|uniref:AAA family ATPase n=1 Tax=Sulfitobacter sp. R18_1 TaxID=2821104 RepID=UPI001ADBFE0D|nr:AAA family ATPase [Sulfitobacter sp. R18_1]MBO9428719.1 AAA family ATPase [Sulfitobacter sp. R18_1]